MSRAFTVSAFAIVAAVAAACGQAQPSGGGAMNRGTHASARILVKKDGGGVCKSRTIPKSHVIIKGDEDEIVWDLKVKDGCLASADLVLKWTLSTKNPTTCTEVSTAANGNKSRIRCNLATDALGTGYDYKVYLRVGGVDTLIEDPDVEIVEF